MIGGLSLVSVTAQAGDNVHRIFESLNNTGLRLTQADLIRNYLFMRLPTRGDHVYHSLWLPLQERLDSAQLELLFWLDLVQRDETAKQTDTYALQQVASRPLRGGRGDRSGGRPIRRPRRAPDDHLEPGERDRPCRSGVNSSG